MKVTKGTPPSNLEKVYKKTDKTKKLSSAGLSSTHQTSGKNPTSLQDKLEDQLKDLFTNSELDKNGQRRALIEKVTIKLFGHLLSSKEIAHLVSRIEESSKNNSKLSASINDELARLEKNQQS